MSLVQVVGSGLVDNSSSESLRPATCSRDPGILLNAQHNCTEIDLCGSRPHAAGRRDLNCQQPLVLFHGWGVDASVWQPLIPRLEAQYELYLVELFDEQLAWPSFKKTLLNQLPERFGLLGWSMGGLYATRLALEESTRVSHLINVASSPCFIESDDWPGISRDSFMSFYNDWLSFPDKTQQNFIKQQCGDAEGMYSINSQMALRDGLDAMLTWDFREDINSLCMPTAYLFGRLDRVIARHTMRAMQVHYPPFNYHCFTKAAHMPFISSSLEFDVWLTNFYSV